MKIFLHTVNDARSESHWLNLPAKFYSRFPNKPMMPVDDVKKIFDPARNSLLQKGKAMRWFAYDQYNFDAGRIAAFYLPGTTAGQIGFFECFTDRSVAHELFRTAITWLKDQGCSNIEGPVNFGEKDRFWGLMTMGFETKGLYLDNFNPPYYKAFFDSFKFVPRDTIYTYRLQRSNIAIGKLSEVADWSEKKIGYELRHFQWKEKEHLAVDLHSVYTASFNESKRISHLSPGDILCLIEQMRPLLNEKYCWIAYKDKVPIAFILFLQEPFFDPTKKKQKIILKGFALAVIPSMRGKGIEAALCRALYQELKMEEKEFEIFLSGINACTTKMNSLIRKIGGEKFKVHQTFTYKI